jgi:streptogramin lyase
VRALAGLVVLLLVVPVAGAKIPPPPEQSAVVRTGGAPCGLAAHDGSLWVGVYEAGSVLRLDRAGRVRQRVRIGRFACQLAVTDAAVWVTRDNANRVVRIDRWTGRTRVARVSSPYGVVEAAGAIWVTSFETGTVTRLHPRTARPTRVLRVGGNPTGIARCGGSVWVGHGREATWLTAVDPRTNATRRIDVVVESPRWPRCIGGQLWVTTPDAVLRVAPRTGELLAHVPLGDTLAEAAAATDGTVWVTDKQHSRVHRIEPTRGLVLDSFPAGPGALSLTRFAGSMWVSSFAGTDVRRFDP